MTYTGSKLKTCYTNHYITQPTSWAPSVSVPSQQLPHNAAKSHRYPASPRTATVAAPTAATTTAATPASTANKHCRQANNLLPTTTTPASGNGRLPLRQALQQTATTTQQHACSKRPPPETQAPPNRNTTVTKPPTRSDAGTENVTTTKEHNNGQLIELGQVFQLVSFTAKDFSFDPITKWNSDQNFGPRKQTR